jgi:hypothetical protein
MGTNSTDLLAVIDRFLAESGRGDSYFDKRGAMNRELVKRLREGRRVWPETEHMVRSFIAGERAQNQAVKGVGSMTAPSCQPALAQIFPTKAEDFRLNANRDCQRLRCAPSEPRAHRAMRALRVRVATSPARDGLGLFPPGAA